MPSGPKGQKRLGDVIGNAADVMLIAICEETPTLPCAAKR